MPALGEIEKKRGGKTPSSSATSPKIYYKDRPSSRGKDRGKKGGGDGRPIQSLQYHVHRGKEGKTDVK